MRFDSIRVRGLGPFAGEVSLDLSEVQGPIVAVTGPNGAGKSTLLELMAAGLYREAPTRGSLAALATARDAFVEVKAVNGSSYTIRHLVDAVSGKGEAVVLDESGRAVLTSSKLREFDQWAAAHLPPPQVLYSSTFAPQGSGGFLELKPGDRKAVLLRVLGIERLELLAERAREKARDVKGAIATLAARIEDERARGGDVAALETELADARELATKADTDALAARDAFRQAEVEASDAAEAARAHRQRATEAATLRAKAVDLDTKAADLSRRLENNLAVLKDAAAIRAAVERVAAIDARLAEIGAAIGKLEGEEAAKREAMRSLQAEAGRAGDAAQAAEERRKRAETRLADRGRIEGAVAAIPGLRADVDNQIGHVAARERELRDLQDLILSGAERRIDGLRGGLTTLASGLADAHQVAVDTLTEDDRIAEDAASAPSLKTQAEKELAKERDALRVAENRLRDAEAIAARLPELESAAKDAEAAKAERDKATAEAEALDARASQMRPDLAAVSAKIGDARTEADNLRLEKSNLAPLASKAGPLAQADARVAELDPQLTEARKEAARLRSEADAIAPAGEAPTTPDLAAAQRRVEGAESASREAHGRIAVVEQRIAAAREAADRLASLEGERRAAEDDLADWILLADSLGRDGLQALEIDAAGPELTELVNDLLRTCVGSRWTVSIETTKLSADGKRQLEDCEVRVLDTERGRDGAAETLSGGERVLVGEAVSLALSMLACRRSGVQGPTLVRDESGAALDPVNARGYVAMLRRAAEIVGARHVLFVSHSPEVQDMADARIVVRDGTVEVSA